jgi:hypothetical protein
MNHLAHAMSQPFPPCASISDNETEQPWEAELRKIDQELLDHKLAKWSQSANRNLKGRFRPSLPPSPILLSQSERDESPTHPLSSSRLPFTPTSEQDLTLMAGEPKAELPFLVIQNESKESRSQSVMLFLRSHRTLQLLWSPAAIEAHYHNSNFYFTNRCHSGERSSSTKFDRRSWNVKTVTKVAAIICTIFSYPFQILGGK